MERLKTAAMKTLDLELNAGHAKTLLIFFSLRFVGDRFDCWRETPNDFKGRLWSFLGSANKSLDERRCPRSQFADCSKPNPTIFPVLRVWSFSCADRTAASERFQRQTHCFYGLFGSRTSRRSDHLRIGRETHSFSLVETKSKC